MTQWSLFIYKYEVVFAKKKKKKHFLTHFNSFGINYLSNKGKQTVKWTLKGKWHFKSVRCFFQNLSNI